MANESSDDIVQLNNPHAAPPAVLVDSDSELEDPIAAAGLSPPGTPTTRLLRRGSRNRVAPAGVPVPRTNSFMVDSPNTAARTPPRHGLQVRSIPAAEARTMTESMHSIRQSSPARMAARTPNSVVSHPAAVVATDFDEISDSDSEAEERGLVTAEVMDESRKQEEARNKITAQVEDEAAENNEYHNVSLEDIERRLESSYVHDMGGRGCKDVRLSIDPRGPFMKYWDVVMLVCLLFVAHVTPFEIAYINDPGIGLVVINWIVDSLFVCDMIVNFFLGYFTEHGQWEFENLDIVKHYLKGWFLIDLISIIPFKLIADASNSDALGSLSILRIIRLLRLIKLVRVVRASRLWKRFEMTTDMSYASMTMVKYLVVSLVSTHWMACVWHLVVVLEGADENWVNANEAGSLEGFNEWSIYAAAFYTVMQGLVMGYPNLIYPITTAERIIAIFVMFYLGAIYGYVIGSICDTVSNLDPATNEFQANMDHLTSFMHEIAYPKKQKRMVREYFHHCKQLFRTKFHHELLETMSPTIQEYIAFHQHGTWVSDIPFFHVDDESERRHFISSVALRLEPLAFAPEELIIREGEFTTKMYIIQRGLVAKLGRVLGQGRFFGEDVILRNSRRKYFVRVLTYLDVYALSREDLDAILDTGDFDATRRTIRRAAIRLALQREMVRIKEQLRMHQMMGKKVDDDVVQSIIGLVTPVDTAAGTEPAKLDDIPKGRRPKAKKEALLSLQHRAQKLQRNAQLVAAQLAKGFDEYRVALASNAYGAGASGMVRPYMDPGLGVPATSTLLRRGQ